VLVKGGQKGRCKTQPILWTERPTGAVMGPGSLWPRECVLAPSKISQCIWRVTYGFPVDTGGHLTFLGGLLHFCKGLSFFLYAMSRILATRYWKKIDMSFIHDNALARRSLWEFALPSAATLGGHQDGHHILVTPPLWALPTTYT
jgi:hypothetical protein